MPTVSRMALMGLPSSSGAGGLDRGGGPPLRTDDFAGDFLAVAEGRVLHPLDKIGQSRVQHEHKNYLPSVLWFFSRAKQLPFRIGCPGE